jgi:hypothetical protein
LLPQQQQQHHHHHHHRPPAASRRLLAAHHQQQQQRRCWHAAVNATTSSSTSSASHLPSCVPTIRAVSAPLPLMPGEKAQRIRQDAGALMLVLCMTLAASVLSASFVVYLVR